ncbi:MAG: GNAT family N-acetyltransferase [Hyphomicrobiales bacterium]|nr:GNAT family N-acetyltransferase [Hyphomicrobiales bacterium]
MTPHDQPPTDPRDPGDPFQGLVLAPLTPGDAAIAGALVREAGWNQVAADWRLMIGAGDAVGLFTRRGGPRELVATALALPYGTEFAWISMVLVAGAWRRRGLATALLRDRIDAIRRRGMVPMLDATEAGREVYRPLGFHDLYGITRLQVATVPALAARPAGATPVTEADLEDIVRWDAPRFGAERGAVLADLYRRAPELAWVLRRGDGAMAGYVLGRDGGRATQVGPLVAEGAEAAIALLDTALAHAAGPVFIDLADGHPRTAARLAELGFTRQRGFVRMALGRDAPFDDPVKTIAIAGPELG